jgi:uncharacterized protein (TIGR00369 family)
MPLDPAFERAVRERLERSEFRKWMGFDLTAIDSGRSELRFVIEAHHLNPGGVVHGGVIATLLDAAIGLALRSKLGTDRNHVTLQLDVHYVSIVREGTVIARGTAVRSGERASYGEAELVAEDGRLLARGAATFLTVGGDRRSAGDDDPDPI